MLIIDDVWKVGVKEVRDATAPVLIPTKKVKLAEETFNTFIAWPRRLVKLVSLEVYFTLVVFLIKK